MRTLAVVVGDEERDRKIALWFGVKGVAVQALVLDRAVEPLDPAVRPRVVRLGAGVADPERRRALVERALVSGTVVGEDPLDPDARSVEGRDGVLEERDGVRVAAARSELGDHDPAGKVDGHVQLPPADERNAPVVRMAAAAAIEAAEALGVHRDELTGDPHVERAEAAPGLGEQVRETVRAVPKEDPVDARGGTAEDRADPVRAPPLLQTQCEHARFGGIGSSAR